MIINGPHGMGDAIPSACRSGVAALLLLVLSGCLDAGDQGPDPIVVDYPIAYIKRPLVRDDQGALQQPDIRDTLAFNPGADVYVRDRASPGAAERNITAALTQGEGDVRDLEVSYDGSKLLFALREPAIENADEDEQPTWDIYEYAWSSGELRAVMPDEITNEAGQDVAPHYLPDGRIVFSSTRQRQAKAILLDEGKPQFEALDEDRDDPALVLHVMNANGTDIKQLSFNQSHDFDPTVLTDGRVLFSRWDHAPGRSSVHLYTMNPDGTQLQLYYGAHSHTTGTDGATVQFMAPRQLPDGRIMTTLRPFTDTNGGGELVFIDTEHFIDNDHPVAASQGLVSGTAQSPLTDTSVRSDVTISPGGRFADAYPLWDGTTRALVSWSPCRVVENERIVHCTTARLNAEVVEEADPLYGVYLYDWAARTQLPVVPPVEGTWISEAVALHDRALPSILEDQTAGAGLNGDYVDEAVGVLHIRSVYDFDGNFDALGADATNLAQIADPAQTAALARPARFLRIEKPVSLPDEEVWDFSTTAFGRSAAQGMREIIGYAPIEPDGSVLVKVPANVALALSVLDADGRRIGSRHLNWLQVKPGETLECNGCHTHASGIPHGRTEGPAALNDGAATGGIPFPNTTPTWLAEMGETMAQTRARISCLTDCSALAPSVDVLFSDVWTDPAVRAPDAAIAYRYGDLTTTPPVSQSCRDTWTSRCRTVIHYETHIHPLWSVNRGANTCTGCHSPTADSGNPRVPFAQLDLSDGASSDEPDHFKSYRELLFQDNEQELVAGVLQDRTFVGTDADGNPVTLTIPVPPSMSTNGANASTDFFALFDAGGSHAGRLTEAELRLLAEWLDLGAQYYNNPFDAPQE